MLSVVCLFVYEFRKRGKSKTTFINFTSLEDEDVFVNIGVKRRGMMYVRMTSCGGEDV
jgi:hypothetical protein